MIMSKKENQKIVLIDYGYASKFQIDNVHFE